MSERWTLHHGDCLAWLRTLPSESVDAVVTDPPAGIAFMGKQWDHHKGGRAQWVAWLADVMRECLRVLKPGGHALVWSLPRTEHWTACAVEDAGFEIRDAVTHLFAQGWPKSLDVSKAIDERAGAVREVVGRKVYADGKGPRPGQPATSMHAGYVRPWMSDPAAIEAKGQITAPATDDAKRWQGWGTALKPAQERWVLARKPLAGTVAENVLAHGTGALNVDGCRVESGARPLIESTGTERQYETFNAGANGSRCAGETTLRRWPSNVILSHAETCADECDAACPVQALDAQSGHTKSNSPTKGSAPVTKSSYGVGSERSTTCHADEGGASRFFPVFHPFGYFPKAKSASQRGGRENKHPTVKHIGLMRWLVRLVTPRGGLVLDPFGGSGTTGVAALCEGMRFAAAEADADSYEIARKRLTAAARGEFVLRTAAPNPTPAKRQQREQSELFDTHNQEVSK